MTLRSKYDQRALVMTICFRRGVEQARERHQKIEVLNREIKVGPIRMFSRHRIDPLRARFPARIGPFAVIQRELDNGYGKAREKRVLVFESSLKIHKFHFTARGYFQNG